VTVERARSGVAPRPAGARARAGRAITRQMPGPDRDVPVRVTFDAGRARRR
jgi:hypothetical protein